MRREKIKDCERLPSAVLHLSSHMIHPLRSKSRRIGPAVLVGVLLLGGGSAFWFGLQAFRTHADQQSQEGTADVVLKEISDITLQNIPSIAILSLSLSGEQVGRATRIFVDHAATIEIFAELPPMEISAFTYDVWLVKDGLADVVNLGPLTPRADGSWAGTFVADPAAGVIDPTLFSEIVIMLEARDGNEAPSGVKVSEGEW